MSKETQTTIRRFGIMSYGTREDKRGSYIAVEDFQAWLRDLTDDDSRDAMIEKIDAMKEQLDV